MPVCFTVRVKVRGQFAKVGSVPPQRSPCLLRIKIKFPGLAANTFTQWAMSPVSRFVILCGSTTNILLCRGSPHPNLVSITL